MAKKQSIASQAAAIVKAVKVAEAKPMPAPMTDKSYEARERRYKAEDALRTLTRAEECKRDKTLMSDVRRLANEQMKSLQSLSGGRRRGEK